MRKYFARVGKDQLEVDSATVEIKSFCDVCGEEIPWSDERRFRVEEYVGRGSSYSGDGYKAFVPELNLHKKCVVVLETALASVLGNK